MARAPLLQLSEISLTFGGDPVFHDLSLTIQEGDRLALVGRNGSGKSTLLKVMAGLVEPDSGARVLSPGDSVGYMEQEPDMEDCETLGDFALRDLDPSEMWRVEAAAEGLKFDVNQKVATASGGERRRAALAKLIAEAPDLMLLDEPTNHLDIHQQIQILQLVSELAATDNRALLLVMHDLNLAARYCNRFLLLFGEGETTQGDAAGVLTRSNLERLYQHPLLPLQGPQGHVWLPQ